MAVTAINRSEWRRWLKANHSREKGVWLILHKLGSGVPSLTYAEAVEEALCFGWIDGKPNKLDARRYKLWFAPRKPKSGWSNLNKLRVKRLIAAKRMSASGLAAVKAAKQDGSWSKLDASTALVVPPDLRRALQSKQNAKFNFDAFPNSVKRAILEWISAAKKSETRKDRIATTATLASKNIRANQWREKRK